MLTEPQGPHREVYAGPFDLDAALAYSPEIDGARMAETVYEGDYLCVLVDGRKIVRKKSPRSGQGGSVMERDGKPTATGMDAEQWVLRMAWRPL